jgi:hypothetical protein
MAHQRTESKRMLSDVIAEWACALKYEHLSPAAIQAAKLFWFDSIGWNRSREIYIAGEARLASGIEQPQEIGAFQNTGAPPDQNNQAGVRSTSGQRNEIVAITGD